MWQSKGNETIQILVITFWSSIDLHLGLLYAVGGYDGASRHCLATVEAYNPKTDSWALISEMSCRRSGAGREHHQ